jgi:hypothetical protein
MNSPVTLEQSFDLFTGVTAPGPATRFVQEQREQLLASEMDELAGLRFSIVITARWEASEEKDPQRREELRMELNDLRARYADKIDHIAMSFGVAQAIEAKDEVERNVTVPLRSLSFLDAELQAAFESAPEPTSQPADDELSF